MLRDAIVVVARKLGIEPGAVRERDYAPRCYPQFGKRISFFLPLQEKLAEISHDSELCLQLGRPGRHTIFRVCGKARKCFFATICVHEGDEFSTVVNNVEKVIRLAIANMKRVVQSILRSFRPERRHHRYRPGHQLTPVGAH